MKRIVLMLLGLLTISMFLVGCAPEEVELVDEEGNIVGEAIKFRQLYRVKEPLQITTATAPKELVLVGFSTIKDHYGSGDFQTTKSASQICQDLGHSGCFAGQMEKIMHYYESTDGSCRRVQLQPSSHELVSCAESGSSFSYELCNTVDNQNAREPELGDNSYHQILTSVICLK